MRKRPGILPRTVQTGTVPRCRNKASAAEFSRSTKTTWRRSASALFSACPELGPFRFCPTKPFSPSGEIALKQIRITLRRRTTRGRDHAPDDPELNLPTLPPDCNSCNSGHDHPMGSSMTEAISASLALVSIAIFLAHAYDLFQSR